MPTQQQFSNDRQWWWDGTKWRPAGEAPTVASKPPSPSSSKKGANRKMALFGALALVLLLGVCTVAASSLGNNSNPATNANANQNQDQNSNPGIGDYQIAGHTYDQSGAPISGVDIYIRIVPLSYGALYRTKTAADGSYSYKVPEGVYNVLARIGDPISTDLEPVNGSRDVSVPPGRVLDFQLR